MKESGAPIRPFPASGGECAAILDAIDWDTHPLGEPADWPLELKTVVRTCLTSKFASMVHWDDALFTFYNDAYAVRLGRKHPGHLGQPAYDWWSEMWDQLEPFFARVLQGESYYSENARYTPDRDGQARDAWFTHSHSPIWDDSGAIRGIYLTVVETTAQIEAEARTELLTGELKHRMKNTMAIVQSIVNQAMRRAADMDEARRLIHDQVGALARTNDLLTRTTSAEASMADLVAGAAELQGTFSAKITSAGPDLMLSPQAAIAVTMLLHELTTNAMKYGALSNDTGQVRIAWETTGDHLDLTWHERGGPPVIPPARPGFGTRLLTALAGDLGGTPDIRYDPQGVSCTLRAKLSTIRTPEAVGK